jgi:8-oxo-dGTP diphosphatase
MAAQKRRRFTYNFPRPALTVDLVVVTRRGPRQVLLIRRKEPPFAGKWALPGGFVEKDEPLDVAARRELKEETGVSAMNFEQLYTFGNPGRDPRDWTVSVAYLARVAKSKVRPRASDDAAEVGWFALDDLPDLAFDHAQIVERARKQLRD